MSVKISIYNHKGGIGKTTSCVSLGTELAASGKRVLLIDTDPQCHVTFSLFGGSSDFYNGLDYASDNLYTIDDVVGGQCDVYKAIYTSTFLAHKWHSTKTYECTVDILIGSKDFGPASLNDIDDIKKLTEEVNEKYDYILFDTPPAWNEAVVSVLVASNYVLVPVRCNDFKALDGYNDTLNHISELVDTGEAPDLKILGTFLTFVRQRRQSHRAFIEAMSEISSEITLFNTLIMDSEKVEECAQQFKPLCEGGYRSVTASGYKKLAAELEKKIAEARVS